MSDLACNVTLEPTLTVNIQLNAVGATSYLLPTATSLIKGGVRIGARLTMSGEVLSADVQGSTYTLPVASASVLGGVKKGDRVSIDANGVISADVQTTDISGKVDKVSGSSLVADTEIAKIHASGSDNQDLSGLQTKESGKGLSTNDLTAGLKSNYDTAYNHSQATHAPTDAVALSTVKADTDIADALSKKHSNSLDHSQGTDQGLDTGGTNAVTAAQAKAGYTHSGVAHAPADAVSLATVKGDADIASAISLKHAAGSDAETASTIATINHAAAAKVNLVDADEITGQNSESNPAFGLIRSTWTSVKAFLKTYFDTLYAVAAHTHAGYQATLESGTNIKTVGGVSLLGSGDVVVNSGIWTALTGAYASTSTFTFTGTNKDVNLIQFSLFTCTSSDGNTRRIGYVKSSVNNAGTITVTVVTDTNLAAGDINFKVAYNRKVDDYIHLISIPGEVIADASYSQGVWRQNLRANSYLLPVDFSVLTAAAGSDAACTMNIYKNTTALFSSAPDLGTNAVLVEQRPTTNTLSAAECISLRIMSSAGATNKAADFQAKLYIVPTLIYLAF
jgi:hypothetical protein